MTSTIIEDKNWLVSVADIPVLPPDEARAASFGAAEEKATPKDMGEGDPATIIYVNFTSKRIPEKFNARLKELESMMQLTHQWLDTHAGIQTKDRKAEGALPTDEAPASRWKRSDYRVKVIDSYLSERCSWIYNPYMQRYQKSISTRKVDFHFELVKNILTGLIVPTSLNKQLEDILSALSETVAKTEKTSEDRAVLSLIHVFTYDEMKDDIRATFRCMLYSLNQDMKKIIVGKSSYERIELEFHYQYGDYSFNEDTWKTVKPEVQGFINGRSIKQIRDTTKIPV
ncbi:hypothetical protein ACJ73_10014 [Blastomyces percursus]|uniref:Uncharacterized protein n=1 Tax=Blastomyces percursus TaxID=1658174 RepID=A0A1J9Q425_9EURO|nr:hypothetical protein ACJ73_10014 [Blastomyces percursus]